MEMEVGHSLGCRDHEIVELSTELRGSRAVNKIMAMDFRSANSGLFRDILGRIPWEQALQGRGIQGS